nr:MAG TPA: hypothetical protein [Bacteriophage sp.]
MKPNNLALFIRAFFITIFKERRDICLCVSRFDGCSINISLFVVKFYLKKN